MDAVDHGRSSELAGPGPAPVDLVVSRGPIPRGVAGADQGSTGHLFFDHALEVLRSASESELKNRRAVLARAFLGGLNGIHFSQGAAKWFLAQDPGASFHGLDRERRVRLGRRGDDHDVRGFLGQEEVNIGIRSGDIESLGETARPFPILIHHGDEFRFAPGEDNRRGICFPADMMCGDITGANEGDF